jgi:hypothetical protein
VVYSILSARSPARDAWAPDALAHTGALPDESAPAPAGGATRGVKALEVAWGDGPIMEEEWRAARRRGEPGSLSS